MTDLPPGYKMTELGPLPQEWQVGPMTDVVRDITSGDWGEGTSSPITIRCLVLRGTDFAPAERGNLSAVPVRYVKPIRLQSRRLFPGDILIEMSGGSEAQPTGRALLVTDRVLNSTDAPVVFSNFVKRIQLSPQVLPDYCRYYWEHLYRQNRTRNYERRTTGIRNFRLNVFLESESIVVPPLPEQRAIAHVLRTVQDAIEATERVIAATKELKRSLMRHLFTYGPVPVQEVDQVLLKETEIGPVPQHWAVVPLGDVVVGTQYGLSRRGQSAGEYPILRMNNLEEGSVRTDDLQYVDLPEDEYRRYSLTSGDILFNRTNSYELVGKTALFESSEPFVFASYLVRVVPDHSKLLPRYLNFYLNSEAVQNRLRTLATRGASQSNISATKLRSLIVGLPPLREQRQSVEWLAAVDGKVRSERMRLQGLRTLFSSLLQNLMTGKVRVSEFAPPEPQEAM